MAQDTFASRPSLYNSLTALPHSASPLSLTASKIFASAYIHSFPYNRLEQLPNRSNLSRHLRISKSLYLALLE
jgi:hypothetical protein